MGVRGLLLVLGSGATATATLAGLGSGAGGWEGRDGAVPAPRAEAGAEVTSEALAQQTAPSFLRTLESVRGMDPVACGLVQRSLGNRWGGSGVGPVVDVPDGAGAPDRAALDAVLTRRPASDDLDGLLAALDDGDRCVRNVAAVFLGWMKDPESGRTVEG